MEGLDFGGILGEAEVNDLFGESEGTQETQETKEPPKEEGPEEKEEKQDKTAEVTSVEDLFDDGNPESVGSEEEHKEKEDTKSEKKTSSPNTFSSIARAFADEGILPDLSDEEIGTINSPESLRDAIEKQIKAGLDEKQKRIDTALNNGVEVTEIQKYERAIDYLDSIQDSAITAEGDQGDNLRKQLILQDFINRGYSKERAAKMVERSFNAGTDIDDAKEALKSNREFFKEEYDDLMKEAEEARKEEEKKRTEQAEKLKKSILEDKKFFGEVEVDKATRQKVFDNISKPVYKSESGEYYTALQNYEREHRSDFLKNVGLLFTLTDGFKSLDKLVKGRVKREVGKGFKDLEQLLSNTSRTPDGNLKFVDNIHDDPESFFGKGIKLDL